MVYNLRLKKIAIWSELPLDHLRQLCLVQGVSAGAPDGRVELVSGLIAASWPPRVPPTPPPPRSGWENHDETKAYFQSLG